MLFSYSPADDTGFTKQQAGHRWDVQFVKKSAVFVPSSFTAAGRRAGHEFLDRDHGKYCGLPAFQKVHS